MNKIERAGISLGMATTAALAVTTFGAEMARETDNAICSLDPTMQDYNGGHCSESFTGRMEDDFERHVPQTLLLFALGGSVIYYAARPPRPEKVADSEAQTFGS